MRKITIYVIIITLFVKLTGFFQDVLLSYFYGASIISDSYLLAIAIPSLFFAFFESSIKSGLIPRYAHILEDKGEEVANKFVNNILTHLIVVIIILIVIINLFTYQILSLFTTKFSDQDMQIAVNFTRIISISLLSNSFLSVFKSYLNIKNVFVFPAFSAIIMHIIIMVSIPLSFYYNLNYLVYGYLIASFSQILVLIPAILKTKFKIKFIFNPNDKEVRRFIILVLPILLGVALGDLNKIVDKTFASMIMVGGISILNYAHKIEGLVQMIIVMSVTTVIFPTLSKQAKNQNLVDFKNTIAKTLVYTYAIIIPATFGLISLSTLIINLAFGRGAFDFNSMQITANVLVFYSIGIVGYSTRSIIGRGYYALSDTLTPLLNAIISVVLNILLNFLFFYFTNLGLIGLALSTSISGLLSSVFLVHRINKKIGSIIDKSLIIETVKIVFASTLMLILVLVVKSALIQTSIIDVIQLLIIVTLGIISYYLSLTIFRFRHIEIFNKKIIKYFLLLIRKER